MLPFVVLRKGAEYAVKKGAYWIYNNQIDSVSEDCSIGDICDVFTSQKRWIGRGFFNPLSVISVRLLPCEKDTVINDAYFQERITEAIDLRKDLECYDVCRLFFAESDGIPGLIVDKYEDYLSIQILSAAVEKRKESILQILIQLIRPKGIIERDDMSVRGKEGLPEIKEVIYGEIPELIQIHENGIPMWVDLYNGQKTGYFLDQRENRKAIQPYVKNKKVLDCFCHTGGFSVHAAYYGAKSVHSVDISEEAIQMAQKNAELNHLDQIEFECGNVFDVLHRLDDSGEKFDTVILDPPGFIKNHRAIEKGKTGYKEINLRAMKIIRKGGYLLTYSCSQLMTPDLFLSVLRDAAHDLGRKVNLIEMRMQSQDHPADIAQEQPLYLKCFVLRII